MPEDKDSIRNIIYCIKIENLITKSNQKQNMCKDQRGFPSTLFLLISQTSNIAGLMVYDRVNGMWQGE